MLSRFTRLASSTTKRTTTLLRPLSIASLPHLLPRRLPSLSPSSPTTSCPARALPLLQTRSFTSHPSTTPFVPSDLSSHSSTRALLAWQHSSPRSRSVEIIKRRKWDSRSSDHEDGEGGKGKGEWEVEVYLQDVKAEEGTDLREGRFVAKARGEDADDALTEAVEEALDLLRLAEREDYPSKG